MRKLLLIMMLTSGAACQPEDQQPGFWLSGEVQTTLPEDWSFTKGHREIYIEVGTPYLIPHSVTIWCAENAGELFVAANRPESKNWPGWVVDRPDVKLKIGDGVYPVTLQEMNNPIEIAPVQAAYALKYQVEMGGDDEVRYWRVLPRSG